MAEPTITCICAIGTCRYQCGGMTLMMEHLKREHRLWKGDQAQITSCWAGHQDSTESFSNIYWHYVDAKLAFKSKTTVDRTGEDKEMWEAFAGGLP